MFTVDHMIQFREPLSLSNLQHNLQIPVVYYTMCESLWLRTVTAFGGGTVGRDLLHMDEHGNTSSCVSSTRMAGFLQQGGTNSHVGTWEDRNSLFKVFLVLKPTY